MKIVLLIILSVQCAFSANPFEKAFERVWSESKKEIYPENLVSEHFTEERKIGLQNKIAEVKDWTTFESVINPFLLSLGVSHTYFYSKEHPDYYFMKSLFTTHDITQPAIYHVGMQLKKVGPHFVVRNVWNGYPAEKVGLRRGDKILNVAKRVFHPLKSFASGEEKDLTFLRSGKLRTVRIRPIFESPHLSMIKASKNSVRFIKKDGKKLGYFHLWTGTSAQSIKVMHKAVSELKGTDGLILDLRGGFGGAWWDHLDPFFENRTSYFVATVKNRSGKDQDLRAPEKSNKNVYKKPMVVLSNEGVRSGKEALVHQFKKTKRGLIVGTTTSGMFSMGRGVFSEKDYDYILYLAVAELLLDGIKIEGVGITPDQTIDYPLDSSISEDPQLAAGVKHLIDSF